MTLNSFDFYLILFFRLEEAKFESLLLKLMTNRKPKFEVRGETEFYMCQTVHRIHSLGSEANERLRGFNTYLGLTKSSNGPRHKTSCEASSDMCCPRIESTKCSLFFFLLKEQFIFILSVLHRTNTKFPKFSSF